MIKTAGTTLHYIFRNSFGYNYVEINKKNFSPIDLKLLLKINRHIKAIGGHSLRFDGNLDYVCSNIKYITFLRDPIDRFLSHYNHGKFYGHHSMSLEERVKVASESNYQTKFILGKKEPGERDFKGRIKDVEKAKEILSKDYAFVGIVEQFDESLILMKKQLSLNSLNIRYEKKNVLSYKGVKKDDLSYFLINKIREVNRLDYELYNFAKGELFEPQKIKYGNSFRKDLKNFRNYNKDYKFNKSQIFKFRLAKYLLYWPLIYLSYL